MIGKTGQRGGIALGNEDGISVQIISRVVMTGMVLQVNQRGAIPQAQALLGAAAIVIEFNGQTIVGRKLQFVQAAGLSPQTWGGAGGGIDRSLGLLAQWPHENIHGVVGVTPYQTDVVAVLG